MTPIRGNSSETDPEIMKRPDTGIRGEPVRGAIDDSLSKLVKKAKQGRRNLILLGSLLALLALFLIVVALPGANSLILFPGLGMLLVSLAYFFLAVAAGRGSSWSLAAVILLFFFNLLFSAISYISTRAKAGVEGNPAEPGTGSYAGVLIALIVIIVLYGNYKAIMTLKERKLWKVVFGACKPAKAYLISGLFLLLSGTTMILGGNILLDKQAEETQQTHLHQAECFIDIVQQEEAIFIQALHSWANNSNPASAEALADAENILRLRLKELENAAEESRNRSVAVACGEFIRALDYWHAGIELLSAGSDKAEAKLKQGDIIREAAGAAFDEHWGRADNE